MKALAIICILLMATTCYAKEIEVKTGYGYFTKDGEIISKYNLPPGIHTIDDDEDFVELQTEKETNAIKIYAPPPTQEEINKKKIIERIRKIAIDELKAEGELPLDYKDVR